MILSADDTVKPRNDLVFLADSSQNTHLSIGVNIMFRRRWLRHVHLFGTDLWYPPSRNKPNCLGFVGCSPNLALPTSRASTFVRLHREVKFMPL